MVEDIPYTLPAPIRTEPPNTAENDERDKVDSEPEVEVEEE